ncbi:MAG: hypothetical protein KIT08_05975 [Anaerolineales bacterium]|nr:MAG: hypothetical protein KIT08_05975 [Anaerolineales bacterium]
MAWHVYALAWRWVSGLAFYTLLRLLWPKQTSLVFIAGLLFVVYPGFSQQSIAVTYSVYFLYYTLFIGSLILMVKSLKTSNRSKLYVAGSIALGLFSMLCTEYFYGLELVRAALIWLTLRQAGRPNLQNVLKAWAPYALMLAGIFAWRYWASQQAEALYGVVFIDKVADAPLEYALQWVSIALNDVLAGGLMAWGRVTTVWSRLQSGTVFNIPYLGVLGAAFVVAAVGLQAGRAAGAETDRSPIWLGLATVCIASLSFWVADLRISLSFPQDRGTIPMMFGASLLFAGVLGGLRVRAKTYLLAGLIALSVGMHFLISNEYRLEWERQGELFRQLAWRAPSLADNTAIISPELRVLRHSTDNSLTAPLNWMYAAPQPGETLHYSWFYAGLRSSAFNRLEASGVLSRSYDFVRYEGRAENILVVIYEPPGCLRVIDPVIDANYPMLSPEVADLARFSNTELISESETEAKLPYWDQGPSNSWCYYFQKADLARQQQDWQHVVELGDIAFELDDHPNHPAERLPFIEAYARVGRGDDALHLTWVSLEVTPLMQPMLCDLWLRLADNELDSSIVQEALDQLQCSGSNES